MKNRYGKRRFQKRRRRSRLSSSIWGPILKFVLTVLGIGILLAVLTFGVMFALEVFFKIDTPLDPGGIFGKLADQFNAKMVETPTPYISPVPTATPHPMDLFDGEEAENELVFPADVSYSFLGDPYCYNNKIVCSAGKLFDGKVRMYRLVEYDIATGAVRELSPEPVNEHLLFPVFNDKWLVYFDAHYSVGGGNICALDLQKPNAAPIVVKEVFIGQPVIRLYNDCIAWTERTGSDREKVFVCDLTTLETTVVQYFNRSDYGTSYPYFAEGRLIWAAEDSANEDFSAIKYIDLDSASIHEYRPGVPVHDPEYNGRYYAWLDSHHTEDAVLYASDGEGKPFVVAEGVVEFGISDRFIAYGKDSAVYIYAFENGKTYRITPEREIAQFLGVSGGTVMWMDVTSRERDIIKYAIPPLW